MPMCLIVLLGLTPASAKISSREYRAAVKAMASAVDDSDTDGFLRALATVLERNDSRAIKDATDAYGRLLSKAGSELSARRFYVLHGKAARSFTKITGPRALEEIQRLRKSHGRWRARILLLDAASFNPSLNVREAALVALEDKDPAVMRRALAYLSKAKERSVVEAIIERYVVVARAGRSERESTWSRMELAFQAALTKLIGIELPAADDYRNYVRGRKEADLFNPPRSRAGSKTELSLFGASVTGKYIAFVVDTSGSMLSTDRLSEKQLRKRNAKTEVVGRNGRRSPPLDRQRITRAKKELSKVVKALPEGVSFNIISFSSGVESWSRSMKQAVPKNKKKALGFIDSLVASGITVMDYALEEAFTDLSVDTIYLITDGAPTHIGSQGGIPSDAPELMKSILRRMKAMNFLRGVRIFTLGFRGAEEEFLKDLSGAHSGKYVRIK